MLYAGIQFLLSLCNTITYNAINEVILKFRYCNEKHHAEFHTTPLCHI